MKLIIAGPRNPKSRELVLAALDATLDPDQITEIVSGKARGVDTIGETWADRHGIPVKTFPVTQQLRARLGSRAPFYRNTQMAEYVGRRGALVIIHDGPKVSTPGSSHMLETAQVCRLHSIQVVSTDTIHSQKESP